MEHSAPPPLSFTKSVPLRSEREEWAIRTLAIVALAYGWYWLWWRWTGTLNWSVAVFAISLALAETYRLISASLLTWTVWRLPQHDPPPPPTDRTVDVFITVFDEPLQLVRRTVMGAKAIRYPHETYVLDDGKRDEIATMAAELGVGYIRRAGSEHAKAGNLNHALSQTSGEFILQLDADHVALPHMIDRLLGYFNDPKVGFVQSPHDFYNTDSFTHVVNDEGHRMWEENRIFFSLVQPGKDNWGASFFCGSCGMIRRAALEEIGGFATQTVTEDMETSIALHGRGWKSRYHGETLAYGLAPASATQYHVQRLRWGTGSMQILRKLNPLRYPGLTWKQRLQYMASCVDYLDGLQKLVFIAAPLLFFFTGWLPVSADDGEFLLRLVPYMVLTLLSFEMLSRGTGWVMLSERYGMTRFFTYILALAGFFRTKPVPFVVTPKGTADVPFRTYAPQLFVAVACVAALLWAPIAAKNGWVTYANGFRSAAVWVNGAWLLWNLYFAVFVVHQSIKSRQQRLDFRFVDRRPVEVLVLGSPPTRLAATTQDLNAFGLAFRAAQPLVPGTRVRIPLCFAGKEHSADGEVVRSRESFTSYGSVYEHGVRFVDLPLETRDALELHCAHETVPSWHARYRLNMPLVAQAIERLGNLRGTRRRSVQLPAIVRVCEPNGGKCELGLGMLEEMSGSGARLILENPIEPGSRVTYDVPGTGITGTGTVVFNRLFESPATVRFAVGVRGDRVNVPRRQWAHSLRRPLHREIPSNA
jgi:cellulose synthase (UDP-forming)